MCYDASDVECEETVEETSIEALMLESVIDLAKQVGYLTCENESLASGNTALTDTLADVLLDGEEGHVFGVDEMTVTELIELEYTDDQIMEIVKQTSQEIEDLLGGVGSA